MRGRIIITGATGSMGAAATLALAGQGHSIVMACRNIVKAGTIRDSILVRVPDAEIDIKLLDLSSMDSVCEFVNDLGTEPIDALFNNAGTISRSYSITSDGLENTFAVNYFGPYLLTRLLVPRMREDARIVNMVSLTCRFVTVDENSLRPEPKDFSQLGTYARSKQALLRFSMEFSRRYPGICVNLADPGIVNSNMISMGRWFDPLADRLFRPFCKSPDKGVKPALNALSSSAKDRYFVGSHSKSIPARFLDPEMDLILWQETESILSSFIPRICN
ncbi:MAG: SDR family NAD(P)-dependent oxidoreductase [Bacteroidales bacterium]|nr:SDR family NAD(P)-dependent oxidoreductase [Bacteroidales bacterium]